MKVVFCGTPQFAIPTLEALVSAGIEVRLVVTQPDRPSGRGMELTASPVKKSAHKLGLPITQPEKIKNNLEFRGALEDIRPEAIVVVGYGRIIPQWMIDLPPLGNINLHASLLPKYRGAAPVQWAIAMGESVTGVTTMKIDAGLDTGDILLQVQEKIAPEDTAETLGPRLAMLGAPLMVETLRGLQAGVIMPRPQDNAQASLAPILKKEDGLIDFTCTATELCNRLRGFQPWPGAWTAFRGKKLNVWEARVEHSAISSRHSADIGALRIENDRLCVGCGQQSTLELLVVQPEGKKRMSSRDFAHGYHPKTGEKLGEQD